MAWFYHLIGLFPLKNSIFFYVESIHVRLHCRCSYWHMRYHLRSLIVKCCQDKRVQNTSTVFFIFASCECPDYELYPYCWTALFLWTWYFLFVTEIARQAAQIKLLRKLQKQEQARAAKEAKKQQGKNYLWRPVHASGLVWEVLMKSFLSLAMSCWS